MIITYTFHCDTDVLYSKHARNKDAIIEIKEALKCFKTFKDF